MTPNGGSRQPLRLQLSDYTWHDALGGIVNHVKAVANSHALLGEPTADDIAEMHEAIHWMGQLAIELKAIS